MPILSPLRYPGSKRRQAPLIGKILQENTLRPELFVELFSGGASVALHLLLENRVGNVGLVDIDPLISSFWKTVFFDTKWLVEKIRDSEITLEEWKHIKTNLCNFQDDRTRAYACLFLNRTSFSGILKNDAGPIGGYHQKSQYTIDCRFPKDVIIERIETLSCMKKRVAFVWCCDWKRAIQRLNRKQIRKRYGPNLLCYFDPPFFVNGERLCRFTFDNIHHRELRRYLDKCSYDWILSYDDSDQFRELYNNHSHMSHNYNIYYTVSKRTAPKRSNEVLVTKLLLTSDGGEHA